MLNDEPVHQAPIIRKLWRADVRQRGKLRPQSDRWCSLKMDTRIALGLSEHLFAEALALKASTVGIRPVDAVEELLTQTLVQNICDAEPVRLHKPPSVKLHSMYYKNRCASLAELARGGYETWYVELKFATAAEAAVESFEVEGMGLELRPINYGPAGLITHRLWSKKLKTQTNHILRLNHLLVPPNIFARTIGAVEKMPPLEQPFIANPRPGPRPAGFEMDIEGFELVSFDHVVNGKRHFCACARPSHEKIKNNGTSGGTLWNLMARLLAKAEYQDGVCHLCVANRAGPEAAADLYGDSVQEFVAAYITQMRLAHGMDKATARSEVQQTLGLSRWVREAEMHGLVKKLFPEQVIFREASPPWLKRQRLDVYIPALNLAMEHQGEQHYKAVKAFGGDAALQRNFERDALKKQLCAENGVHLVEIRFDDPLTLPVLRQRLQRFLGKA